MAAKNHLTKTDTVNRLGEKLEVCFGLSSQIIGTADKPVRIAPVDAYFSLLRPTASRKRTWHAAHSRLIENVPPGVSAPVPSKAKTFALTVHLTFPHKPIRNPIGHI